MRSHYRWLVAAGALAGFLGGLAACQDSLRRERAALCRRALPAVAPGAGIRLLRVGPGAAPDTMRVDYADGHNHRWFVCRFGTSADLTELTGEGLALSGAALHMLKRFYLDTPDAAAADPDAR